MYVRGESLPYIQTQQSKAGSKAKMSEEFRRFPRRNRKISTIFASLYSQVKDVFFTVQRYDFFSHDVSSSLSTPTKGSRDLDTRLIANTPKVF